MERCSEEDFELKSYWLEHAHRYSFAARLAIGDVADCACGIGYGSVFFKTNTTITSYIGLDPNEGAINTAISKYSEIPSCRFKVSTLENLPLQDDSVDTFVSLETLEHLIKPIDGLAEIKRVLRDDGIFIGSVPTSSLEELATLTYGLNEYHLHKFNQDEIVSLLNEFFEHVEVFNVSLVLGTYAQSLNKKISSSSVQVIDMANELSDLGSYFFICGKKSSVEKALDKIHNASALYFPGVEKIIIDTEERIPLLKLANTRWDLMTESYNKITELQSQIKTLRKRNVFRPIIWARLAFRLIIAKFNSK